MSLEVLRIYSLGSYFIVGLPGNMKAEGMRELETDFLGLQDQGHLASFLGLLFLLLSTGLIFPFPKVASEFLDGDNKTIRTCYQELSRGWSGCVP